MPTSAIWCCAQLDEQRRPDEHDGRADVDDAVNDIDDLEAKELQPVAQTTLADESLCAWWKTFASEQMPHPPARQRAKAENDQVPFSGEDATDFAKDLVRVRLVFERVWQQHRVCRI